MIGNLVLKTLWWNLAITAVTTLCGSVSEAGQQEVELTDLIYQPARRGPRALRLAWGAEWAAVVFLSFCLHFNKCDKSRHTSEHKGRLTELPHRPKTSCSANSAVCLKGLLDAPTISAYSKPHAIQNTKKLVCSWTKTMHVIFERWVESRRFGIRLG